MPRPFLRTISPERLVILSIEMSDRSELDPFQIASLSRGLGDVERELLGTRGDIRRIRFGVSGQPGVEHALRALSNAERSVDRVGRDLSSLGSDISGRLNLLGLEGNVFTTGLFGPTLPGLPGSGTFPWPEPGPDINLPEPPFPGPDINFPEPRFPGPDINIPEPRFPGPDIDIGPRGIQWPPLDGPIIQIPGLPDFGGILHSENPEDGDDSSPGGGLDGSPPAEGPEGSPPIVTPDPTPEPTPTPPQEPIDDILNDPEKLRGKSPEEVEQKLGDLPPAWKAEKLGAGSHAGQGWMLREYGENGEPTGRYIRWHPGGGHHGPDPYWRTGSPRGGRSPEIPGAPSNVH